MRASPHRIDAVDIDPDVYFHTATRNRASMNRTAPHRTHSSSISTNRRERARSTSVCVCDVFICSCLLSSREAAQSTHLAVSTHAGPHNMKIALVCGQPHASGNRAGTASRLRGRYTRVRFNGGSLCHRHAGACRHSTLNCVSMPGGKCVRMTLLVRDMRWVVWWWWCLVDWRRGDNL